MAKRTPLKVSPRPELGTIDILDAAGDVVMYVDKGRAPITADDRALVDDVVRATNACVGINPAAVPKLLAACELVAACLATGGMYPVTPDGQSLRAQIHEALALARQEPQDGQGTRQESPESDDRPEIDPGAAE